MEHEPLTSETLAAAVVAAPPGPSTRAAVVPVRLTRGERDQLAEVSRDMGLSLSAYVRQVFPSRPLPARRAVRPHLLQGGANVREVQTLLGHQNVQTTAIYTRVDTGELRGSAHTTPGTRPEGAEEGAQAVSWSSRHGPSPAPRDRPAPVASRPALRGHGV